MCLPSGIPQRPFELHNCQSDHQCPHRSSFERKGFSNPKDRGARWLLVLELEALGNHMHPICDKRFLVNKYFGTTAQVFCLSAHTHVYIYIMYKFIFIYIHISTIERKGHELSKKTGDSNGHSPRKVSAGEAGCDAKAMDG